MPDDGSALGPGDAQPSFDAGVAKMPGHVDAPPEVVGASDDGAAPADAATERSAPADPATASVAAADAARESAAPAPPPDASTAEVGGTTSAVVTYEAESGAFFGRAAKVPCATCSNGQRVSLGADSGLTLYGVEAPEDGTAMLVLSFTNGDTKSRSIYVGVNGGGSQLLLGVFTPTGGWDHVSSLAVPLSGFNQGSNNTLMFFIDTELGAPDLDGVALATTSIAGAARNACDRSSWNATASVTAGDGSGPAGAIDGDLKTRWANNRPQAGVDWYQVDFGALVKLYRITLDNTQGYPSDFPGSYAVYASLDGVTFDSRPFVTGAGTVNATVINFAPRTARAVKIAQVGSARNPRWWQIGELRVGCYQ